MPFKDWSDASKRLAFTRLQFVRLVRCFGCLRLGLSLRFVWFIIAVLRLFEELGDFVFRQVRVLFQILQTGIWNVFGRNVCESIDEVLGIESNSANLPYLQATDGQGFEGGVARFRFINRAREGGLAYRSE